MANLGTVYTDAVSFVTASVSIRLRLLLTRRRSSSLSISCIFNKSLNEGSFPSKWKDCNLTPVFKSDQKDIVSNCGGISLLPILSKVLERHVHTRLHHHVLHF